MASSCIRGGLDWILGKISSLKALSNTETGCPGKWWSHHTWRYLKDEQTWHLGTWLVVNLAVLGLHLGMMFLEIFSTKMILFLWFYETCPMFQKSNRLLSQHFTCVLYLSFPISLPKTVLVWMSLVKSGRH